MLENRLIDHYLDLRSYVWAYNFVKCCLALENLSSSDILKVDIDAGEAETSVIDGLQEKGYKVDILYKYLKDLKPNSKTGEIYFTDIINNLIKNNKSISSLNITDWRRLVGLNTQKDLEWMQSQNMI